MIVELHDVTKSFGALKVTDGVSLSVPRGQALGIIGPNGAGKSTLFNLITGNFAPDAGRIVFLRQDVAAYPAMRRVKMGVGRSFQIPQPFEGLTVFENLFVAACFGQGKSEAAVAEDCAAILEQTELMRRANTPAGALSLLERKRLELARAMATGPELLLLDEIAGRGADGGGVSGAGGDDQGDSRAGHDDRLDRTCAACAQFRSGAIAGSGFWPGDRGWHAAGDDGIERSARDLSGA